MRGFKIFVPFIPGLLLFFAIYGLEALNFTSLAWFPAGFDPFQSWMGWSFFRDTPWSIPPGLNPRLGLELNNSILFTDSNPLFAFFFKIFSPFLPAYFQYAGLWLCCCLLLQSLFGYKLTSIYTKNSVNCFLGACLFSMSMPMIYRMGGHFNLVAHFLILAALCLCLEKKDIKKREKSLWWAVLLAVSSMIHTYIFIMLCFLWAGDLGDRLLQKKSNFKKAFLEAASIIGICALTCWLSGYFIIGNASSDGGFGLYRMNVWSIFDSNGISSWIIPDLPSFTGEYEGYAYLGMGGILVIICALATAIIKKPDVSRFLRIKWPFLLALLGLAFLALSNTMGIFIWEIHFSIPKKIEDFLQFFRSSGRMFWPVFYVMIIFSLALIFRYWKERHVFAIMLCAVLLQSLDVAAIVVNYVDEGHNGALHEMDMRLKDPFWEAAGRKYKNVRGYPARGEDAPSWVVFNHYALKNGMGTNIVYLSRYNTQKLEKMEKETLEKIRADKLDSDSFYIVNDDVFKLAQKTVNNALIQKIDGFNVIAPNWP